MYAIVDCNNFYVSCQRVFNPALNGKPVIVLSNNDGCAISRSDEAKALGVTMGAIPHLFPRHLKEADIKMFSSNYVLYGDMSDRVMKTLKSFVPRMEVYSIDEAFLDVANMPYVDLYEYGIKIRKTVLKNLGIPTCVGIAPTKALAKMANRYAKKTNKPVGVFSAATPEAISEILAFTAVGDVWGIGRQYADMLVKNNVKTAADFAAAPQDFIRSKMSVVGLRLQNELRCIPSIAWNFEARIKQNIGKSACFGTLQTDKTIIKEALANYAAVGAGRLRAQGTAAGSVKVFIHTNPYRLQDEQYYQSVVIQLPTATNSTSEIIKAAFKGLDFIFRQGFNYLKCGVELGKIVPENQVQLDLFAQNSNENLKKATAVLDRINKSFGKDLVRFSVQSGEKVYKARAEHLSNCFTTRISDIIRIKM